MSFLSKTVVLVAPYFPPDGGGLERYAYEIATRLRKNYAWKIIVITSGEKGRAVRREEKDGLIIYRLDYQFKISNTPFSFRWFRDIKRIQKIENVDLVNIHMPVPGIGDVAALIFKKQPLVVTYHTGSMIKGKTLQDILIWLYEHLVLIHLLHRADQIVCASDFVRLDFLRSYLHKSTTITPAVDTGIFKPDGDKKNIRPTLLFVAGLGKAEQHKGLEILFKSVDILRKEIPDIQLIVVGDGDRRSYYEEYISRIGIAENVFFKGRLMHEALARSYQESDVLILPSLAPAESFGMVLIEAMASAKPVIGSRAGGIPTVIDDEKNGLLVNPGDVNGLATAIRRILRNPRLAKKLGEAGRDKTKSQYNWEIQVKKYAELFNEVSKKKLSIIQLVGYYPPHLGGMEKVAEEISLELARRHYEVEVITSNIGVMRNYADHILENYRVHRLNSLEIANTPIMWSLAFRLFFLPKRSLLHIHVANIGVLEIAWIVSKIRSLPLVAHFHLDVDPSSFIGKLLPFYKRHLLSRALRGASKIITFSDEQQRILEVKYKIKPERIVIIPNGVSEAFFNKKEKIFNNETLEIIYVGRLEPQKKVERLLETMALLKNLAHLNIIGDGSLKAKLEEKSQELNLTNVSFKGRKNTSELRSYYKEADVFITTSDREGMSLVALEAMASGLPIIGTNVSGTRELVGDVGILVDEPYAFNLAQTISFLAGNTEKLTEMSANSVKKAGRYSWTTLVDKLETVYKEVSS